ncbi:MAG TPA: zinc ribbon domain-containing protein [Methylomirabilota bacterium]|nr:zinc ribbon domain-containing protein [Methylomirabilota bacterium]
MPIYEYRCNKCKKKVSVLTLRISEEVNPECEYCGSKDLSRLMSRFATVKSEEARFDALADPGNLSGLDENDPKSMARWMRKMGKELGEEFSGDEFDQMVEEMEAGHMPDDESGDTESGDSLGGGGDLD